MSIKRASVALLVSMLSSVLLYAAEMQTRPEVPIWVSDGVTEYRLFIWVDNSGLGGEATRLAEWKLFPSPLFSGYVAGSSAPRVINGFFADFPTNDEDLYAPTRLSGRWIWATGPGPINSQGNVGEYRFTVPIGAASAVYTLNLNYADSFLYSPVGPNNHVRWSPGQSEWSQATTRASRPA
jgi:hypothetical protein